jgi:ribonucleoside-diphosphate reductase alpha chain
MIEQALDLSPNARRVLEARYLRRDAERRVIETPEQMFERVAGAVAKAERDVRSVQGPGYWAERFGELLATLAFLPNSPTLMNAGTALGQLSACFVLPVHDSMESIFDAVRNMALVQRTGGGTGFSFSHLRPRGSVVASTGGEASGPVSFMKIFDCATENIKQGGRRRGANMGVLGVDHPDILEFVRAKRDPSVLQNFNTSVAVTDAFMDAVRHDRSHELVDPQTGRVGGRVRAREVFHDIVQAAWEVGDPGLLFADTIERGNPTPHLGRLEATNPCGEIPLLPYESCNLGSVNLARVLAGEGAATAIDFERLESVVRDAVRFLDDVIEVNRYPIAEIERATRATRKIGLGVMGFAEMLIRLGIPYDSDEAGRLADRVMRCIRRTARRASIALAEERGTYPEARGRRPRHATVTAIAPTGTISILAGTTAGIEPLFALAYRRRHVLGDASLHEITPLLRELLEQHEVDPGGVLAELLPHGRLADSARVPESLRRAFVTALEISPARHLAVQAAFQRWVDNSVSKTINLPVTATPQDVEWAYWHAWELGLKGITIYRYGSRASQVLELGVNEEAIHYDHASKCDPTECRI